MKWGDKPSKFVRHYGFHHGTYWSMVMDEPMIKWWFGGRVISSILHNLCPKGVPSKICPLGNFPNVEDI